MNALHAAPARAAWVCWAIASETRIAYGSVVCAERQAPAVGGYQARIASRAAGSTVVGRVTTIRSVRDREVAARS